MAISCGLRHGQPGGEPRCGPLSNPAFGTVVVRTRYDDDVRTGFGKRGYNWETSAGLQHELLPRVSVNATYFRRSYGNFLATDNVFEYASRLRPVLHHGTGGCLTPGGGGNRFAGSSMSSRPNLPRATW